MKPRSGHTAFRKGTRVLVHMRDGRQIEDVFLDRKSTYILLKKSGRIAKNQFRTVSILKEQKKEGGNNT